MDIESIRYMVSVFVKDGKEKDLCMCIFLKNKEHFYAYSYECVKVDALVFNNTLYFETENSKSMICFNEIYAIKINKIDKRCS